MGSEQIDFLGRERLAETISDDGTVTLSWELEEGQEVRLEQSDDPGFTRPFVRYEGPQSASVLSGLPEGTHHFRLRLTTSDVWSEPLAVQVRFVPRGQLFLLLGAGGLVVVMTVGAILIGFFNTRERGRP